MKIEVNLSKKSVFALVLVAVLLIAGVAVYAYGTSNPVIFGHTPDEINWSYGGGSSSGCPSGFTKIGSGQAAFCISTNAESTVSNVNDAASGCYSKGSFLCTSSQWYLACNSGVISGMTGSNNWISDAPTGNFGALSVGRDYCSDTHGIAGTVYRCCISNIGVSINVGSGALWKSVSLTDTTSKFNPRCKYFMVLAPASGMSVPAGTSTGADAELIRVEQLALYAGNYVINYNTKSVTNTGFTVSNMYESCPSGITGIGQ
ncbi:MAG: hypothetical protein WCK90_00780 [archaeon]